MCLLLFEVALPDCRCQGLQTTILMGRKGGEWDGTFIITNAKYCLLKLD